MGKQTPVLRGRVSIGARIGRPRSGCRLLAIPEGPAAAYRVAQLDDYGGLSRRDFLWRAPVGLQVSARVSAPDLPGTWGFGWWNDPFSAQLGIRGTSRRFPSLPNAAWVFYASPENHLALRDDHPSDGLLAATFSAPAIHPAVLALGIPALPLLLWPPAARLIRWLARRFVSEDAAALDLDPTAWHTYEVMWGRSSVSFNVDGTERFATPVAPEGPLGLVIWIDNQYAALRPDGHLSFGSLANPHAWLEIADVELWTGLGGDR
ncbi:MAG: hypothetical protein JXC32_05630 [Anaerolineae bacterium]|nr:hypothetical protein [Anaerolineae bacterium]